jgi:hypothetical protein
VREQLGFKNVELEALERRVCVLQEAEVQRQRERLLYQEEMDKNRQELQKVQSLQVRVFFKHDTVCAAVLNLMSSLACYI